ncbi:proline dehydrogenase family protein [Halobacteriaceae archaeon SHR40]|uniref:proline dehydrogenase family protein n=1 Tax=Halovenus amylolytica TaxID=2500550 RepID=UPI000FE3194C
MIPPIASNFVAGETVDSALGHVEDLNRRGIGGILNLLGEHYDSYEDAAADTEEYIELVEEISARNLKACISVKPSQLGIDISEELFERNFERIVDAADSFVWLDMEDHTTTDATLDVYEKYARETDGNVGVCVQANLVRTGDDLQRLAHLPGKVRLVKGAYDEPAGIAFTDREKVTQIYRDELEYMFREFDGGIAVGSHDPAIIDHAGELYEQYETPYEIQMLMGVREQAQFELVDQSAGEVYQYIPYGSKWLSYFYRRLRERKENIGFAARAIVSG